MSNLDIKDIAGLGEIVRHIKDLIIMIIEVRAKTEERRIKNETLRLDNAKKFFQIANEHNLTADQLITYLNSINSHFSPNTASEESCCIYNCSTG